MKTICRTLLIFMGVYLLSITPSYGQIEELANEIEKIENPVERISNTTTKVVRYIAFLILIISALAFLYLKDNQSDLTKKAGHVLIGVALFFIVFEVAIQKSL